MYESAKNCSVKSLFAVRIIVSHYIKNAYITLKIGAMTLIDEICGIHMNIIPFQLFIVITEVTNNVKISEKTEMQKMSVSSRVHKVYRQSMRQLQGKRREKSSAKI